MALLVRAWCGSAGQVALKSRATQERGSGLLGKRGQSADGSEEAQERGGMFRGNPLLEGIYGKLTLKAKIKREAGE